MRSEGARESQEQASIELLLTRCGYTLVQGAGVVLRALLPTSMELRFQQHLLLAGNQVLRYSTHELLPPGYVILPLPIAQVLRPPGMFSKGI